MVGIWDWEDANGKVRAKVYQEPPQEGLGEPGRRAHPPLLDGSLCKDHPLISEEPEDPVKHLVVPMIRGGFSNISIWQVVALV